MIRAMEDEDGINDELHPTIVRYCADVLGSLYRKEMDFITSGMFR